MVSRVRRISRGFHDYRSSRGARLWVERAAKSRRVGQTVPTGQTTAHRKNLPATFRTQLLRIYRGQTHIKPTEFKTQTPRVQAAPAPGNRKDETRREARLANGSTVHQP